MRQVPEEILAPLKHLARESQAAAHEMVARPLVLDIADPGEAGHGPRRTLRACDPALVWRVQEAPAREPAYSRADRAA